MKKKQFLALALGGMMAFGTVAAGCGDTGASNGKTTELRVTLSSGGIGSQWLQNAMDRFEKLKANESYAEGKTGVKFKEPIEAVTPPTDLSTEANHIFFVEQKDRVTVEAANGTWMDLTDVIQSKEYETRDSEAISIEDKLTPTVRSTLKIGDKYYGLPHYEYYGGLTYDIDLFEGKRNGARDDDGQKLYLAAEGASDTTEYTSQKFGCTIHLVNDLSDKSCGPDGQFDTVDDGLPTSYAEFFTLCEYMQEEGWQPVQMTGMHINYSNLFMMGVWAQLAGDRMTTYFSLDGEIEVVTGETEENLFPGIDYIKKPKTELVTVADTVNTQAVFNMVERYYAQAVLTIIEREGFFSDDANTETVDHHDTHYNYLLSGFDTTYPVTPFLIEGSFWHNESKLNGDFDLFYYDYNYVKSRNVGWMSLPVTMDETIEENDEKAHAIVLPDIAGAWCYANAKYEKDPELSAAIKDFIAFLYSDAELSHFTAETGLARSVDYQLLETDEDSMPEFYKNLWQARVDGTVIINGSTATAYEEISGELRLSPPYYWHGFTGSSSENLLKMLRANKSKKLWDIFKDTIRSYK
ncbi:MAG: hypothetical protein IJ506_02460 [Clostridia bacterium]|nr:hypothetical protein [Clostridia bacterium]MBQ8657973.1 hypothetical protein [Clostridia bacterium]